MKDTARAAAQLGVTVVTGSSIWHLLYSFPPNDPAAIERGYKGPLSIEWEDSGMDRDWGAPDALGFVRRTDFSPSSVVFDAAFAKAA